MMTSHASHENYDECCLSDYIDYILRSLFPEKKLRSLGESNFRSSHRAIVLHSHPIRLSDLTLSMRRVTVCGSWNSVVGNERGVTTVTKSDDCRVALQRTLPNTFSPTLSPSN